MHGSRRRGGALIATLTCVVTAAGAALSSAPPAAGQAVCRNVAIRSPFAGQTVRGLVPILGSARIDEFGFYKIEWARASDPETWSAVSMTRPQPVVNGLLDEWDTARLSDGTYRLKLTVVDVRGQEPCRVVVERVLLATHTTSTATAERPVFPTDVAGEPVSSPTLIGQTAAPARPSPAIARATATLRATPAPVATATSRPPVTPVPPATAVPSVTAVPSATTVPSVALPASETPAASPAVSDADATSAPAASPEELADASPGEGAEPSTSRGARDVEVDLLAPASWLAVLATSNVRGAFAWGAAGALVVALIALLYVALRRSR